jgi:hypothetical protein
MDSDISVLGSQLDVRAGPSTPVNQVQRCVDPRSPTWAAVHKKPDAVDDSAELQAHIPTRSLVTGYVPLGMFRVQHMSPG